MNLPTITVVGLGPGDERFITDQTRSAIAAASHRYLRTSQHPGARLVADATCFDDVYEHGDSFTDVYATIVERLVEAAAAHGDVLYAVPGSPLVLEQTVRALRADPRVQIDVLPSMSFLDLAYARLGIDPVETGLRLIDGHEFAIASAGYGGPMLVAHTHANWVLSDIKLAVEHASGSEPVVILQRLGTVDECVTSTTWSELDRTVEADHLTCIYIPALAAPVGAELVRFHLLARTLREQCPWDREQTHQSLIKYLIEETYETVDALHGLRADSSGDDSGAGSGAGSGDEALIEELGDLLYQIEFHATIAEQEGRFTIADVARGVHDKLVRRHPHVFGDVVVDGTEQVVSNWDAIKRTEKQRTSVFDGVATSQPSLSYAYAVQRKASKVGFDWPDVHGALPKVAEETAEVIEAIGAGDDAAVEHEIGDLLFAVVNVARHLGVEPEAALRAATHKFRRRFEAVERLATERAIALHDTDVATLDELWDHVKRSEQGRP